VLQESTPLDATRARIELNPGTPEEQVFELRIGHVDPIDAISGVQARLESLGYACGEPTGQMTDATREALQRFQRDRALPVSGEPDAATVDALRTAYLA
jgi:peptidoglycan hydrolase-like protein with peptidoglycan-binding domain